MNISTNTPTARITNNTIDELLAKLLDILGFNNSSPTASNMSQPLTTPIALYTSGPVPYISSPVGYYPTQLAQPAYMTQQVQYSSTRSMVSSGQATVMPYAFTTGTLHDPASGAWNFDTAFNDVNWYSAMRDEYNALIKNGTWTLVPRPPDVNVVQCMWLFRHKYLANGTLSRYKVRLVANGSTQLEGVDVDETFSLVVKLGTIHTVLSLATSRHWPVHQLDVKNAFLHGDLSETVYTPIDTESKLGTTRNLVFDPTLYQSLAGSLQYLTFTKPDISYAVQQVCLYMHDPREPHFSALKRILRYVYGTLDYGLQLFSSSTTDMVAYSDADWAVCRTTRQLNSEYRGVANAVVKTSWLRNLLRELHTPLASATLVYCDNVSAVYLSSNLIQHQRKKHIEIDIHFVHDLVATGQVWFLYVSSRYQFADIFTKGLPIGLFEEFGSSLSVQCLPAQTVREC
uniref:Ribonuclease H-like domain-containing protein n=1 Tax=Tanacetum cinerariifolium TaxID=118510 RepID=A0A699HPI8_TANCI|nr:ribonuclease H-like domain-containing protein [Tanacetum cinerariifolium]